MNMVRSDTFVIFFGVYLFSYKIRTLRSFSQQVDVGWAWAGLADGTIKFDNTVFSIIISTVLDKNPHCSHLHFPEMSRPTTEWFSSSVTAWMEWEKEGDQSTRRTWATDPSCSLRIRKDGLSSGWRAQHLFIVSYTSLGQFFGFSSTIPRCTLSTTSVFFNLPYGIFPPVNTSHIRTPYAQTSDLLENLV